MVYLIDTDVMIDVSREGANAAAHLDSLSDIAISIITAQELIVGARDKQGLAGIDSLLSKYPVTHIDAAIGQLAYDLLKRTRESPRPAYFRFIDRRHRDCAELHAREPEPQALRDDSRFTARSAAVLEFKRLPPS